MRSPHSWQAQHSRHSGSGASNGPAAHYHGLSAAQRITSLRAPRLKQAQHSRQSGSGAVAIMVLLRAAMASARLSVMPFLPPGKRPLRAPKTSLGGGLALFAAAAGADAAGADAGLGVAPAASGVSCAAGVSLAPSTVASGPRRAAEVSRALSAVPSELLHGLTGAAGSCACVAFAGGGVLTRLAISGL